MDGIQCTQQSPTVSQRQRTEYSVGRELEMWPAGSFHSEPCSNDGLLGNTTWGSLQHPRSTFSDPKDAGSTFLRRVGTNIILHGVITRKTMI